MRLALYQPDIPQNTGTILRMAACLNVVIDVIGPAGFDISDRSLRRAALDYLAFVDLTRHVSWEAYRAALENETPPPRSDILLLGRESAGVPDAVRDSTGAQISIAMRTGLRSLNIAVAAAMVLGEALRQTRIV